MTHPSSWEIATATSDFSAGGQQSITFFESSISPSLVAFRILAAWRVSRNALHSKSLPPVESECLTLVARPPFRAGAGLGSHVASELRLTQLAEGRNIGILNIETFEVRLLRKGELSCESRASAYLSGQLPVRYAPAPATTLRSTPPPPMWHPVIGQSA